MPKIYHRGSPVKGATFIASQCGGSQLDASFAFALAQSTMELTRQNIHLEVEIYAENCHVDDGRNRIVRDFLESDCDQLVFIDSDVRWEPRDLKKLIEYDKPVVAGIYPLKEVDEGYPCRLLPGPIFSRNGLIEVEGVPTGFLKIKRDVLEELAKDAKVFPSKDDVNRRMIPIIFERLHEDNTRIGGDYAFCKKWRAKGGRIYIDPEMKLEHYGTKCWSGTYGTFLKKSMGLGLKPMLDALKEGKEEFNTIIDLMEYWGNPTFQASPEFLYMCIKEAREAREPILECGTGLTTICMAVCTDQKIYSLEHDPIWATHIKKELDRYDIKNVEIIYAPIENKWYGVESIPDASLVVCDGPPRRLSDRNILKDYIKNDVKVLFDDYEELNGWGENIEQFGASRSSAVFEYKGLK